MVFIELVNRDPIAEHRDREVGRQPALVAPIRIRNFRLGSRSWPPSACIGYMLQHLNRSGSDLNNHIAQLGLHLQLSK